MEYITVEREASDEFIEKKSRFIGACRPVKTEEEALRFIQEKSPAIGTPPTMCSPTFCGRGTPPASPMTGSPRAPRAFR